MSPGVDRPIEHAIDAAQRYDAEPHVLYVADDEAYGSYPGDEYVHEFEGLEHVPEQASHDAVELITDRATDAGTEA